MSLMPVTNVALALEAFGSSIVCQMFEDKL